MAAPRALPSSSRRSASADGDSPPDEMIGDFQRGKEIGKGSFATVYLARHRKKKSYAAVKVVQQGRLSPKLKQNLETEIKILYDLDHPHIVALFACQETPRYFYLVMEYCQLSDLSQFLKKRTSLATLPETADIFRRYPNPTVGGFHEVLSRHFMKQIASALEYLRSKNLLHRDIKPQNLLLNPAPSYMFKQRPEDVPLAASEKSLISNAGVQSLPMLKIADFGFARHLPQTSMAETLCGSPLYMAPEILRYEKYNARADLWSAGTVLYEMVVGKPPFRAPNHVDLLRRIEKTNDQITFDRSMTISRGMKDLIRKLLKKNPTERMTYEDLFRDPVITDEIPGLAEEDQRLQTNATGEAQPEALGLSPMLAKQAITAPAPSSTSDEASSTRPADASPSDTTPRRLSDRDAKDRPTDVLRRTSSSSGGRSQHEEPTAELRRRPSQYEQPRPPTRPSMTAHVTAPGRQELFLQTAPGPSSGTRMERRPSRTSPLSGPPMVREPSAVVRERSSQEKALREARERTAQDLAFEKEYVMVEKRAVEINAFADELDANRGSPQGAMIRRATTQGHPAPAAGVQPASPSRALQVVPGRPSNTHQRVGYFERRYGASPQSATNMLTKALNAANVRLFGALGTSPPFGVGNSPPRGYGAFPTYPSPPSGLLIGDGNESKAPVDEDTKIVRTMEDAAHRSDVIFGFAEVKYKQILPATPSTADALGIQQIGSHDRALRGSGEDDDKDMTTVALVGVAEEALVLYVKTLAILAKTIDLAGYWWNKQSRPEPSSSEAASRPPSSGNAIEVGKRMNSVVQWARTRFNECLEKSEVVGRKLQVAQWQLPEDHPGHSNNQTSNSTNTSSAVSTSAEQIHLTSGVTAEKLMFDRAVEMSRTSAVAELVGEDLQDCEIGYVTAIMLLEAVLEGDDEPLMRKSGSKKEKAGEQVINGMETEDRQTVIKLIESAKSRLGALRKKMHAAQQVAARRSSHSGSSNATPKPGVSPSNTPIVAGTPPH